VECIGFVTGREFCGAGEKNRLVEKTTQLGMMASAVARMHEVSPGLLFGWKRRMAKDGQEAVREYDDVAANWVREFKAKVLERLARP
jgi:transposase